MWRKKYLPGIGVKICNNYKKNCFTKNSHNFFFIFWPDWPNSNFSDNNFYKKNCVIICKVILLILGVAVGVAVAVTMIVTVGVGVGVAVIYKIFKQIFFKRFNNWNFLLLYQSACQHCTFILYCKYVH